MSNAKCPSCVATTSSKKSRHDQMSRLPAGASRGGVLPSLAAHPRTSPPPPPLYRDGPVLFGATLSPSSPTYRPLLIPSSYPCSCRPKVVPCARSLADAHRSMLAGLYDVLDRLVGRAAGVGLLAGRRPPSGRRRELLSVILSRGHVELERQGCSRWLR